MAYDENTADRIRRALSARRGVVEKKMMGGLAFIVGSGGMGCYLSRKGYFLVRVTPGIREQTLAMAHAKPTDFTGRRMSGFVLIEPEGYRTDGGLNAWVQRGVDNALALAKTGARKPSAKKAAATKAPPKKAPAAKKRTARS